MKKRTESLSGSVIRWYGSADLDQDPYQNRMNLHCYRNKRRSINLLFCSMLYIERKIIHGGAEKIITLSYYLTSVRGICKLELYF
jgi:hypothetical protein